MREKPPSPRASRASGCKKPNGVLIITALVIAFGAPFGLTTFGALDPYEVVDPSTDSAKATEALEHVTGVRADGTVIALVDSQARTLRGHRRVNDVGAELAQVDGVAQVLTPWDPPQPNWIAEDGQSAFVVGLVRADADSNDIAPAVEEAFQGRDDVELGGVVMADDQIADQAGPPP